MTTTPDPNSAVAGAWTGGMSLDSLVEGLQQNQVGSTQQSVDTQRFWSTPARAATDTSREVMQITLAAARRINQLEFDVAIFPQDVTVEFYDDQTKVWTACLDASATAPVPISAAVRDSVPGVLPSPQSVSGHLHPQHSFTGHWRTVNFSIKPVSTKNLRILLSRSTLGNTPTNAQAVAIPYSLAIRNLNLTYAITQLGDVPWTNPGTGEQRDTFASTSDLFGSVVDFSVRVNAATNAIGATSGSNGLTTVWKSEPQPIPWAVVNYYLDCRDSLGAGQTLDRLYLDPLYNGPTVNLYWSNSEPTGAFTANSDPIPPAIAQVNNAQGITGDVLHFNDPALINSIGFVDLDNRGISFDPSRPWWVGGQLNWKFAHGTQNDDHPIIDCKAFTLTWTPQGPLLRTEFGDALLLVTQTAPLGVGAADITTPGPDPQLGDPNPVFLGFDPNTPMTFTAWYDGTDFGVAVRYGRVEFTGSQAVSLPFVQDVTTIRIGGWLGASPGVFKGIMQALVIKQDAVLDDDTREDFLTNPFPYVLGSTYLGVNDPRTDNALVRYHPSLYTPDFPAAMIGGAPDRYADMAWTPIARSYILRKGYMTFSPQRAKYWKLEFTNLSPQPYEVYKPVQKSVQVFPSAMWQRAVSDTGNVSTAGLSALFPGQNNVYTVNTLTQTLDGGQTAIVGTGASSSKTTARIIYDEEARARVGEAYWAWSFLPTHTTGVTPSFESTGLHTYQVIDYTQVTKIGYMVGLRSVGAYKLNYVATEDAPQYVEMFYDTSNLSAQGNWTLTRDHLLSSGQSSYSEVKSQPFPSNRVISGVQFAAQQSEPVQLLTDPDLTDPTMASWTVVGDAVLSDSSSQNPTLDSTRRIDRSEPPMTWGAVAAGYGTYGAFLAQNASYGQIMAGSQVPGEDGGISSTAIALPAGGRVHVAARVTAQEDLTLPLSVQIVDAGTQAILAESDAVVKAGQIVEWYSDYTVGDGVTNVPWLYRDFATGYTSPSMVASFSAANQTTLPPLDTGQSWTWPVDGSGNELSLDVVSNAATVTTESQRNWVNTGNPWGTLMVTMGAMGSSATALVELLRFNPMFLTETGYLGNFGGIPPDASRTYVLTTNNTPYTVVAGDVIRIDFLPTSYVPVGKTDASASPYAQYSMMFWVNGVWKCTRSMSYGLQGQVGLKGRLGQKFTKFNWVPADYGQLQGNIVIGCPRNGNGGWIDPTTMQAWADGFTGQSWRVASSNLVSTPTASWDTTNPAEQTGHDEIRAPVAATTPDAVFWTDTGSWEGVMSLRVRNMTTSGSLAANGTFPTNTTGWTGATGVTLAQQASGGPTGTATWCKLTAGASTTTTGLTSTSAITGLTAGTVYKLECDFQGISAVVSPLTLTVTWKNASGGTISTTTTQISTGFPVNSWWHAYGYHLAPATATQAVVGFSGTVLASGTAGITNITFGQLTGNAACLDFDAGIYLDVHGNLVQNGVVIQAGVFPAPLPTTSEIQFAFTNGREANPAAANQRAVYVLWQRVVVGTVLAANVALMTGTKRGLAGSQFTGATRPSGVDYTVDTSFNSFNWAPSALLVSFPSSQPTWGQVTKNGTLTYGQIMAQKASATQMVMARVVQRGPTSDKWDVDTISLFADPIVWSFSNDGGFTWFPAYEVRNNPEGVLVFPETLPVISLNQKPGTALVWKAVSHKAGSTISSLVIRPWYGGLMSGIDHRAGLVAASPNVMPYDDYGDIRADARFQVWNKPVPRWWWYKFKIIQRAQALAPINQNATLANYPDPLMFPSSTLYPGVS